MMNEGAASYHSNNVMNFSTAGTIAELMAEMKERFQKRLSLFYGVSVSVRYAVRRAEDLVNAALTTDLSVYNRLSVVLNNETRVSVYGSGKSVYIVSLPELVSGLKKRGIFAKYCTANMQYGKEGADTVRASIIISEYPELLLIEEK